MHLSMGWVAGMAMLLAALVPASGLAASAAEADTDVVRATLDNGLRVVIVHDDLAPVVTTELSYLVGGEESPPGFPGTAHAMEHMMFRGSPGMSRDQLLAIASNMGGNFNAVTREGATQYYFTVPTQDLDVALRIAATRMRGVNVHAADWEQERGAIEQEVSRDLSSPGYKFYTELRARMFAGTPYATTGLGTRDSFNRTTAADLKAFYDRWYAPNNAVLVIAGDVEAQSTLATVKRLFGDIPQKSLPQRASFDFQPVTAQTLHFPTDYPVGIASIAWRMPGLRDADYATALVLSRAMASKRGALYALGLDGTALSADFSTHFMPRAGIAFAEGVFPRDGDADKVLQAVQGVMADAARDGVPAELIDAAKRRALADMEYRKNSVSGLANAWSAALALAGAESPDDLRAAIEAVTPEAVNALARKVFDPAQAITAILTPESSGAPVTQAGFGQAESFGGEPAQDVVLPAWAQRAFDQLPSYRQIGKPTDFKLANGLRIIVQPESVSRTVEVFGQVKSNSDLQTPPGKKGVASVTDALFDYGTTRLDRLSFQKALDDISASLSAGSSFSLSVPAANFTRGMELLADNQLRPAFSAKFFEVVRNNQVGEVAGRNQSPDFINGMHLSRALLPAKDPSLRHSTPESVKSLTLDDVESYFKRVFRPDMTTMVVVGDVTPEQVRQVAEKYFGAWQASGPKPEVDFPPVPPNRASRFQTPDGSAVQASVTMAQMIGVTSHSDDRYALYLGNQILGGGSLNTMLMQDLRVNGGLVYGVYSGADLDRHRGTFSVSFGSDPDKVDQAAKLVIRDVHRMQTEPVGAAQLTAAKGKILRQLQLSGASFSGIGRGLLTLALDDKPLDANAIAARRYAEVDSAAIQQVFAKHLRADGFVTAVKGPAGG